MYTIPENVYVLMIGEKYLSGGKYGNDNKVKITINQPTKPCGTCTYNNHISYVKLIISGDSTFEIRIIDFIENIPKIKNGFCPGGSVFGIISLNGNNSRLYLLESSHSINKNSKILIFKNWNINYINFIIAKRICLFYFHPFL